MAKCGFCKKDIGSNQRFFYTPKNSQTKIYFCGEGKSCMKNYILGGNNGNTVLQHGKRKR